MQRVFVFALALAFIASPSPAAVLYSTGFESPSFNLGNFVPQGGWITDGGGTSATIQNAISETGAQAVKITTAPRNSTAWWFVDLSYPVPIATAPVIRIEWSMYLATGTVQSSWGVDVYNEDSGLAGLKRVAVMVVNTLGEIQVWDGTVNLGGGGYVSTGVFVPRNTWRTYRMDLDYSTNTADYYYNGGLIAGAVPMSIASSNLLLDADIFNIGGSNPTDLAYYDNYSVTNVVPCALPGDLNLDGVINAADIQGFANCLLGGGTNCPCADLNGSGQADLADVSPFVSILLLP